MYNTCNIHVNVTIPAGNFDYVPVDKEVLFGHGDTQCVDIQLLNDGLVERVEAFIVDLMNGSVILTSALVFVHSGK